MTEPINPFAVQEFDSSVKPLRPFKYPHHEQLYVDVDDSAAQYTKFQSAMGSLFSLVEEGRLALVTGDSGCGKSAMVNRCAAWVATRLRADHGLTAAVVDATVTIGRAERIDVQARMAKVSDRLYDHVRREKVLTAEGLAEFKENRKEPDSVYPNLGGWLLPDRALVLLMPPVELASEIVSYARMLSEKVLFMFESEWIDAKRESSIVASVGSFTMPVTLRVGTLVDGDVRRFVAARMNQSKGLGRFPLMSDETSNAAGGRLRSVAQLQQSLHSTYERRRENGDRYVNEEQVTIEDIDATASAIVHKESGTS
ncbi:hypothetical protein PV646_21575 [Streptomyces sp. ID05-26A]|nr:hypothetical protein [Streptomyces sp. ID05-26A]